jgi:L-threonylcarbamoyladenylate synthase
MQTVALSAGLGEAVLRASSALRRGGVIIYPTDTLYGLGADALSDEAVDRIHAIKGREEGKPIHAVFADMTMIEEYAEMNDCARRLAERFLPGALTLVLKKKPQATGGIARGMETIGIRIPDNAFCIELARTFGRPYTATSANKSGEPPQGSIAAIEAQLSERAALIDLAVDGETFPMRLPSTVVNVVSGTPVILREGDIPAGSISAA